jgi:hypothetical protein
VSPAGRTLAAAIFSGIALMFSFGALIIASTNNGDRVTQGGVVPCR